MTQRIEQLLPHGDTHPQDALVLAMDRVIIRAQFDDTPQAALQGLQTALDWLVCRQQRAGTRTQPQAEYARGASVRAA